MGIRSSFIKRILEIREKSYPRFFAETDSQWSDIHGTSPGYAGEQVLRAVASAVRNVRDGRAEHERDGVNFDQIQYSWPLLAVLLLAAAESDGKLRVLDFGGSLGTTFYQNRRYLRFLDEVQWVVVEQAHFVEAGKHEFEGRQLRFEFSIESALTTFTPDVFLVASSLQYVEKPYEIIEKIGQTPASHLILERIPVHAGPHDFLTIQTVPESIYPASYPAWIFSRETLFGRLDEHWNLVTTFEGAEKRTWTDRGQEFNWTGAHLVRRPR